LAADLFCLGQGKLLDFNFVLCPDAASAKIQLLGFAIYHDRRRMDIGVKTAVCMVFGMADILTEHRCFSADFTLQGKNSFDILNQYIVNYRNTIYHNCAQNTKLFHFRCGFQWS
jgi:hypothetical protein